MQNEPKPISVKFPLSGEWCAVNTPGQRVPSHGTNVLGQRYAYDFLQIDWSKTKGYTFHNKPLLRTLFWGVELHETYCWSQPIYAPFSGKVLEVEDGYLERTRVNVFRDIAVAIKNGLFLRARTNYDLRPALGNYIILGGDGFFALIAHARTNSIRVKSGQEIEEGQLLAEVGHSGNSTAPHLHFQLMDNQNLLEANGLPCCFKRYQSFQENGWTQIENGIPGRRERIHA